MNLRQKGKLKTAKTTDSAQALGQGKTTSEVLVTRPELSICKSTFNANCPNCHRNKTTEMSGRHGNRNGNRNAGRGGRGRGRGRQSSSGKPSCIKKTVEECHFCVGSSKQASDHETTAEFVVNHIKKTFDRGNDVSEALRKLVGPDTDTWKPTLQMSLQSETDVEQREDKQFEMDYKAELDQAMKRKRACEDNTFKACALLWERCNKAMQHKIASRSDYDSIVFNDTISLPRATKKPPQKYK